jgi:hypothetical protein
MERIIIAIKDPTIKPVLITTSANATHRGFGASDTNLQSQASLSGLPKSRIERTNTSISRFSSALR